MQRRWKLSVVQRADMWNRWKAGQSLHQIGRAFGKSRVSIHFMLSQHGGIAPTVRRRLLRSLTLAEREDISRGIACGSSIRDIAKGLERTVSTVSREVAAMAGDRRNAGPFLSLELNRERHLNLPRAADRLGYLSETCRTKINARHVLRGCAASTR